MPQGFNSSGNSSYSRPKKRAREALKAEKKEPGFAARMLKGFMDRVDHTSMIKANAKAEKELKRRKK